MNIENQRHEGEDAFHINFVKLVASERKVTAQVIECIKQIQQRRLFLKFGHTSLFGYLTETIGYSAAAAQRRIEAARILGEIPEVKAQLESGSLTLSHLGIAAQAFREKAKQCSSTKVSTAEKTAVLRAIQDTSSQQAQKLTAQALQIAPQYFTRTKVQSDESTVVTATFSREQMQKLNRVKALLSHSLPRGEFKEIFEYLLDDYLKRKDPASKRTSEAEVKTKMGLKTRTKVDTAVMPSPLTTISAATVSATTRRQVFNRDKVCQWRDPKNQRPCGSQFQLQLDHKQPRWAGGDHAPENLQLLCATHNRLKYKQEAGIKTTMPATPPQR